MKKNYKSCIVGSIVTTAALLIGSSAFALHTMPITLYDAAGSPLTVGGGLRTTDDIGRVLRSGADKVSINTAAVKNPNLIKAAVKLFGSSTIIVAIEAIKGPSGEYFAYTDI